MVGLGMNTYFCMTITLLFIRSKNRGKEKTKGGNIVVKMYCPFTLHAFLGKREKKNKRHTKKFNLLFRTINSF